MPIFGKLDGLPIWISYLQKDSVYSICSRKLAHYFFFFGFGNKLFNMKRTSLCMKLKDIVHIISKKLYFCKLSQGYRPSKSNKFQSYILPNLSKFHAYVLIRLLRISINRPYRFDQLIRIDLSSFDKVRFDKCDTV